MWRYILKRIVLMIPIALAVTFVIFLVMNINSANYAYSVLGNEATDEDVLAWNVEHGFDKPVLVRFVNYIGNILHGDFGRSLAYDKEIWPEIKTKFPVSVKLAASGMFFAVLFGIPIGILSAVKQYSVTDRFMTIVSLSLAAIPPFWLAMIMQLWLAVKLKLLPTSGIKTWTGYILPALVLGLNYAAQELRYTRTTMLETIRQEYIDTARSKGVPERKIIMKHALKNALLPVITVTGNSFGGLIGGAVVMETIFALPGLGYFLQRNIIDRDANVVCGCVVILSITYSFVILAVDLLHALIDPRIKARYAKKV